jgi:ATP-dependent helicase Lhr and Lhr-like helicase
MGLDSFHPVIQTWFRERFGAPTEPQRTGWPAIAAGTDTLIAAPTGSGKTLAAFLACLDQLVRAGLDGQLADRIEVLYVSPLKALGNDIERNLRGPLAELAEVAARMDLQLPPIRTAVRSGDTPAAERAKMVRRPPHILVTTPESLYILLTAGRSRDALRQVKTVIVDEIHAVAGDKRGAHLALSLERLDWLADGRRPVRVGLSATQRPIEDIGRLLVGARRPMPAIVDAGHARDIDMAIELPDDELGAVASTEMSARVYDRIAELVAEHRTTLVFVNTRRLVERVAHALGERLGEEHVAAHHGSLSRRTRFDAEQKLKSGQVRCAVATASLELGIDVGVVDLVVQLGSPRSIATMLQRVGRSGHSLGATPKGRLFAMTRDQLVECAALVRAIRRRALDRVWIRNAPLDVLAQQIVAAVACEDWGEDDLYQAVCQATPYRNLARDRFDAIVEMLADGVAMKKGRSAAHIHRDRVNGRLRGRRGARLAAITSGGAIPDNANYTVVSYPEEVTVGTLDEDFAIESLPGDIFLLGNTSWRIRRVSSGKVIVEDAKGEPPNIPFWLGEAPARTAELCDEVSALREDIDERLERGESADRIAAWLSREATMAVGAAAQLVAYLEQSRAALGALPSKHTIVAERFFDEGGGMQLVIHSPLGGRINKAWGLALRKRFCKSFNFELQAAATDDGIVISLGPMHSFPLETVFEFVRPEAAREVLTQAVLQVPMFGVRWRWNATRSLAILRRAGGKKVPPFLIRLRSDDLLAAVFPDQQACQDNIVGPIEVPDHPLVEETLRDCLTEAMDLDGLTRVLEDIVRGEIRVVSRDTAEPSPLSHEILNANPYAFLDDAPLEERRTRAVTLRRSLGRELDGEIGKLDLQAIATVAAEARPVVRNADELHDALLSLVVLWPVPDWQPWFDELVGVGRATCAVAGAYRAWIAAERVPLVTAALAGAQLEPRLPPLPYAVQAPSADDAVRAIVQGHLECQGPSTALALAEQVGLDVAAVDRALLRLEGEGLVLRGQFRAGATALEWCDRRILARIHRLTLGRLRKEIEPVTPADLMRFLFRWQHVHDGCRLHGAAGTAAVIEQLQGFEAAAAAWERDILPSRIERYQPPWLDALCWSGEVLWGRLSPRRPPRKPGKRAGGAPSRSAPIAVVLRADLPWLTRGPALGRGATGNGGGPAPDGEESLSAAARDVLGHLRSRGASFATEIVGGLRRLPSEIEDALWELVAAGLATADGFVSERSRPKAAPRGQSRRSRPRPTPAGRWSVLSRPDEDPTAEPDEATGDIEAFARQLLARYGVVFRDLLPREPLMPPWRDVLMVLRRLEARGELRGGRFVSGFVGEQYAVPEAIAALRAVRRRPAQAPPEFVRIAATDPLNLVGITSPGPRVPAVLGNAVLYRDGVPVASIEGGELVTRVPLEDKDEVRIDRQLRVYRAAAAH